MKQYRNRIYDTVLWHRLEAKGAVLVEGPKWCGKTTTCLQLAQSVLYMAQPDIREQNIMLADMQPSLLLQGATPRLIDEWQIAPKLWDAVRLEVDQRDEFNQFLLTGSSVPPSFTDITHTGTGRIARLRMRPMSLYESGDSTGAVSFASLFEGESMPLSRVDSNIEHIAFLLCRGGWPKAIDRTERIALPVSRLLGCHCRVRYLPSGRCATRSSPGTSFIAFVCSYGILTVAIITNCRGRARQCRKSQRQNRAILHIRTGKNIRS